MTKSDSPTNYLEIMSSGIAIIVPAGFVISVICDWGFLYALNLGFRDVPTTITDHFKLRDILDILINHTIYVSQEMAIRNQ